MIFDITKMYYTITEYIHGAKRASTQYVINIVNGSVFEGTDEQLKNKEEEIIKDTNSTPKYHFEERERVILSLVAPSKNDMQDGARLAKIETDNVTKSGCTKAGLILARHKGASNLAKKIMGFFKRGN